MTDYLFNKKLIEEVLGLAVYAPSGDNGQPWKFKYKENKIDVILIKSYDKSLYNYCDTGSIFANGALIENIEIILAKYNIRASIKYFPNGTQSDTIAQINLQKDESINEPSLFPFIRLRHTNRKFYNGQTINQDIIRNLINIAPEIKNVEVRFLENLTKEKSLVEAISYNDRLLFENKYIHDILFNIINWSDEDDKRKRTGLFIKTLEMSPDQNMAFRKFRNWKTVNMLNKFGITKLIARQSQRLYSTSSAIGVVVINTMSPLNYLLAGRVFQRLWLRATKEGLSIHPVTGIAYLASRIKSVNDSKLSKKDIELIMEADKRIRQSYNLSTQTVAMLFRIGYSEKSTASSRRLPPVINT